MIKDILGMEYYRIYNFLLAPENRRNWGSRTELGLGERERERERERESEERDEFSSRRNPKVLELRYTKDLRCSVPNLIDFLPLYFRIIFLPISKFSFYPIHAFNYRQKINTNKQECFRHILEIWIWYNYLLIFVSK